MEYAENVFPYSEFPQEKELKGEVIELDTALFRCPFRIRVEGDKAIVMDLHGIDYYAHLFKYPGFQYLSSFGRLGFSSSGDSLLRDEAVILDEDILRPLDFAIYNDTTFIIPDYSGENRLCWLNDDGELVKKIGAIPSINNQALRKARPALAQAWRSFIDYNSHNGVLAMVTQLGEVLEVYNLKDSTEVIRIGENGEPKFKIFEGYGIPSGIMGFSDVQVTDNAIYAVFHGTTFKEIVKHNGHLPDGGKYIYVFSLKGEPLYKYVLDHYVYGFWVDEATKTIIATDINNDQPIVRFQCG